MKKRTIESIQPNEVVNCTTLEEAIEINKVLNPEWTEERIKKMFAIDAGNICFETGGAILKSFLEEFLQEMTILPASDFLPDSFYNKGEANETVEPKVGQVWQCVQSFDYFAKDPGLNGYNFTQGLTYAVNDGDNLIKNDQSFWIMSNEGNNCCFTPDDSRFKNFRFVSEPATDKLKIEEEEDEPIDCDARIKIKPIAEVKMVCHSPDYVDPRLIEIYLASDAKHRELMKEKMPSVEFPKEKEYVEKDEFSDFVWPDYPDKSLDYVVSFQDCTPEINEEKGEIRFVKTV